jgi:streptomycin 3"-adenylyltransferase
MYNNPQSWSNCNVSIKHFINGFIDLLKINLENNLVGIYLHGSLAMNSYFPPKSDIDIIAVVCEKIQHDSAKLLNISIAKYSTTRENIGDLEFTIITADTAKNIPQKIPYEIHYSGSQYEKILNDEIIYGEEQYDNDLFSHLMYIKNRGICLYGESINEVFGNVEWEMFMMSILEDLDWILDGENIYDSPIYGVLNICRVLKLITSNEEAVQSKYEGGKWGIKNLPNECKPIIKKALEIYCSNEIINRNELETGGIIYNRNELNYLCDYIKNKRNEYLNKYNNGIRPYFA